MLRNRDVSSSIHCVQISIYEMATFREKIRLIAVVIFNSVLLLTLPLVLRDWIATAEMAVIIILLNLLFWFAMSLTEQFALNGHLALDDDLERGVKRKKRY